MDNEARNLVEYISIISAKEHPTDGMKKEVDKLLVVGACKCVTTKHQEVRLKDTYVLLKTM